MIRRILWPLAMFAGLAAAGLVALRLTYGGGEPYPDLTTRPLLAESELESVASYGEPRRKAIMVRSSGFEGRPS